MLHKVLTTRCGDVHYWSGGSGTQTVIFTHGATMDHDMFQHQADHFSGRYRVITWDVPAHGLSKPYQQFSMQNAAQDLVAVMDQEGVNQAHLVGQSMGGYICQIAAVEHPERVSSITTIGSSPVQTSYYSRLDRWLLSITPALLMLYPYQTLINTIAKQTAIPHYSQVYVLETLKKQSKREIACIMGAVYQGVMQYDSVPLTCPVLITYGEKDVTGKVRAYCQEWAKREGRQLVIIPDAAHNANMDNPEVFNRILDEFLTRLE